MSYDWSRGRFVRLDCRVVHLEKNKMYDSVVSGKSMHFNMIEYQNYIYYIFSNIAVILLKELSFSVDEYKVFHWISTNREITVFLSIIYISKQGLIRNTLKKKKKSQV